MQAIALDISEEQNDVDTESASKLLKAFANPHRFHILCLLRQGERTVTELEQAVGIRQPSMSQQLARLRADGVVNCQRNGKSMLYSLANTEAVRLVDMLVELYSPAQG